MALKSWKDEFMFLLPAYVYGNGGCYLIIMGSIVEELETAPFLLPVMGGGMPNICLLYWLKKCERSALEAL